MTTRTRPAPTAPTAPPMDAIRRQWWRDQLAEMAGALMADAVLLRHVNKRYAPPVANWTHVEKALHTTAAQLRQLRRELDYDEPHAVVYANELEPTDDTRPDQCITAGCQGTIDASRSVCYCAECIDAYTRESDA